MSHRIKTTQSGPKRLKDLPGDIRAAVARAVDEGFHKIYVHEVGGEFPGWSIGPWKDAGREPAELVLTVTVEDVCL